MIKSFAFAWQVPRAFLFAAVGALVLASSAQAQGGYGGFLEPGQAFRLAAEPVARGRVALAWQIAPGYYLYRDRMKVTAVPAGVPVKVTAPPGAVEQDPNYGTVEVYHEQVRLDVSAPGATALQVTWQGCAEAGLCYPPEQRTIALAAVGAPQIPGLSAPQAELPALASPAAAAAPEAARPSVAPPAAATANTTAGASDDGVTAVLQSRPVLWTVPLFVLLGIGLAFTPCVLPMLPIVSSMVVGHRAGPRRAFVLSLAFVLAMATVYALLGIGAALAGGNLQAVLQNPFAIGATAALFAALSLSMFGWYELQVPAVLRERLAAASPRGGGVLGAAALGALSALLVSPCMTAPLAGTLLYIAQTGNVTRGAVLLFALGIGMGLPMLAVSVLGARVLPRPGPWMDRVKAAFGFALLATAVGMLQRIVPPSAALVLWGAWLAVAAVALWPLSASGGGARVLARGAALVAGLWAGALVIGASAGAENPWRPLEPLARGGAGPAAAGNAALFETVTDPRQLLQRLDVAHGSGEPVLVDFSADWCTSCKTLDREVFDDAAVRRALGGVVPLRVDVTADTAAQQALMREYGVMGPPTVMLFDAQGRERRADRLVGEFTAADLLARVQRVQSPS